MATKKEYVLANYATRTNKQLANELNTTVGAIRIILSKNKVRRTLEQLQALGKGKNGKGIPKEQLEANIKASKKRYAEFKSIQDKERRKKEAEERKIKALVSAKAKAIVERKSEEEVKPIKLFEEISGYHWVAVTFPNGTKGMAYRKK